MAKYATIKNGKVKLSTKSKQFKYLMANHLPLSVVTTDHGKKRIERLNVK